MQKEINEADFMNLTLSCVGFGIIPTGHRMFDLAKKYAAQQNAELLEALQKMLDFYWEGYSDPGKAMKKFASENPKSATATALLAIQRATDGTKGGTNETT